MIDRRLINGVATAALVLLIGVSAALGKSSTAKMKSKMSPLVVGKTLVASKRCNGCHGAALTGVPQFSPSIRVAGVLKEYNKKSFEVVLASGKTNDGGQVEKPMPVYHLPAAQADAIYAYIRSLN